MTPYFSYVTQFADKYTTLYFNLCTSIYNNGKIITSIYYWSDSMIWVRGRKLLACWTKDWEKRENKKIIRRNMSLKRFILPDRQYWDGKTGLLSQALKHSKKLAELYDVSVNYLLEISENQAAPAPVESPDKSVHPAEKEKGGISIWNLFLSYTVYTLCRGCSGWTADFYRFNNLGQKEKNPKTFLSCRDYMFTD